MTALALMLAGAAAAATPFSFNADGTAIPLPPTQFALLYDDAANTMNPATPPERAATRRAVLERIEERRPKVKGAGPPLVLEQSDDLLAVGKASEAIDLLVPYSREREPDFQLMANLVRAYAQAGDWDAALRSYEFLLDASPPAIPPAAAWRAAVDKGYRLAWLRYQRDLVRNKPDAAGLKPIPFFPPKKERPDSLAIVQQLALDAPSDLFLLWSLAEETARAGDFRTAEQLFNRCANSGLTQPKALMARRAEVQDIVETLPKLKEEGLMLPAEDKPPPAPKGLFDLVDPVKFFALVGAFAVVAAGLLFLQVRSHRRKRRRSTH
jgi:tetratricopeptide (TPR) repeat protein